MDRELCENCKNFERYPYLSPCTTCKVIAPDNFEPRIKEDHGSSHEKVETEYTLSHEKVNDGVPFVSFGNDEVTKMEMLGSQIKCRKCGKIHNVECGKRQNPDGTMSESNAIQFTKCDDGTTLMVGIMGKKINKWG